MPFALLVEDALEPIFPTREFMDFVENKQPILIMPLLLKQGALVVVIVPIEASSARPSLQNSIGKRGLAALPRASQKNHLSCQVLADKRR